MKILLDNEDVFYIAMDLSKGGGEPVDTMDAIEAGAKIRNVREVKKCFSCNGKGYTRFGKCVQCDGRKFTDE